MAAIPEGEKRDLKRRLKKDLKSDVTIKLFTRQASVLTIPGRQECPYCVQTQQLMEEMVELSPKLNLEVFDFYGQPEEVRAHGVERIPAVVLSANGDSNIKYYGFPTGYEFATVLEGVINVSKGVSHLSTGTRKALRKVNQPVHLQVFVTPSCPHCPRTAVLAYSMAMENPLIKADVVEAQEFPGLSQRYGVRSVPLTVINDTVRVLGSVSEDDLVSRITQVGTKESDKEKK